MFPPSGGYSLDIEAISGICGSISIACWVVVFSPQIIENFRRSSAEGLSIEFIIIWLAGDVFNILGAVLQGVLPTMIILAIYYTIADIVLLGQCFYYRGFTFRDPRPDKAATTEDGPTERTALIGNGNGHVDASTANGDFANRRLSQSALRERFASLDGTHLSPATPMHPAQPEGTEVVNASQPRTWVQAILFNSTVVILVIISGIAGYYLSPSSNSDKKPDHTAADDQAQSLQFSLWGQIFGYVCTVLYLGSRVPQLLLNYRRKSTEGLNALFFLFACVGNLTYVLSIFAYEPLCIRHRHGHWRESHCQKGEAAAIYGRYILVNLSWLLGSLGTLFLDMGVFAQFFLYRGNVEAADIPTDGLPRTADGEGRGREP
ncbi:Hypothetical protein R9X50_00676100 [Acrodontium crateriforme]|uniref:PQ loop repeat protein n=1 Tax=Acrodontium crateriforme TaxID=150365 RepID=A0AAQ3MBH2_9PEZI|nr:Hypothetical protein R9X50_00676100 [Acrodontium crateriforme]